MRTVGLATSEKWPHLSPDDAPLIPELKRLGIEAESVVWSDHRVDWRGFDLIVIRSCWDYHLRIDEFLRWVERIGPRLVNDAAVVRWNSHKSYLLDLESKGVRIPKTQVIRSGAPSLDGELIVKPAVSASSFETHRAAGRDAAPIIDRLLARGDVIVQEFIPDVIECGEWSIMFFNRVFSHSVLKRPKSGDFRVQEELGGTSVLAPAPEHVIRRAGEFLALVRGDVTYARVDVVDRVGGVTLMELELIEPMLFLELEKEAPRRFAEAIASRR